MWPSRYVIHPRCLACAALCARFVRGAAWGDVSEEARPAGALWAAVPHRTFRAYMVLRRSILEQEKAPGSRAPPARPLLPAVRAVPHSGIGSSWSR